MGLHNSFSDNNKMMVFRRYMELLKENPSARITAGIPYAYEFGREAFRSENARRKVKCSCEVIPNQGKLDIKANEPAKLDMQPNNTR